MIPCTVRVRTRIIPADSIDLFNSILLRLLDRGDGHCRMVTDDDLDRAEAIIVLLHRGVDETFH